MRALLFIPLLAIALVGFVFVRSHQGDAGLFLARQTSAQALTASGVANVVKVAPDPNAEPAHVPGRTAQCSGGGSGALHNPWTCVIVYPSGRRIQYQVTIRADGSYVGDHEVVTFRGQRYSDTGAITGCCITVP